MSELQLKEWSESRTMQVKNSLSPRAVLEELFILLEDYAPVWYTQEHQRRALAVLLQAEP